MNFKECMSLVLATTLVYTSCGQIKKQTPTQRPDSSQAATQSQIDTTEDQIVQQQNAQAGANGTIMNNQAVNSAINGLIAQGNMYIKDYEGNDVSSTDYKLNPSQYYLLFKEKNSDTYKVLNSNVGKGSFNGLSQAAKDFFLSYKVYEFTDDISNFTGASLGEPITEDAVDLTASAAASLNNKAAVNALIERMQSNQLAYSAGFSDFVAPTAHADWTKKDSYLTVAIIFSSVALISYLFALWGIGNVSLAVGIVFWFLYWFYDQDEY